MFCAFTRWVGCGAAGVGGFVAGALFLVFLAAYFLSPVFSRGASGCGIGANVRMLQRCGFNVLEGGQIKLVAGPANVSHGVRDAVSVLRGTPRMGLITLFTPRRNVHNSICTNREITAGVSPGAEVGICSLCNGAGGPAARVLRNVSILMCSVRSVNYHDCAFVDAVTLTVRTTTRGGVRFIILSHPGPLNKVHIRNGLVRPKCCSFIDRVGVPCVCNLASNRLTEVLIKRGVLGDRYGLRVIGVRK